MTITLIFPACALPIGEAIDPHNPADGLAKAVAIVGEARVRSIAETLSKFDGRTVNQALSTLSASWSTTQPMRPVIDYLRDLGPTAVMSATAARLFAQAGNGFDLAALAAITPAVRLLAGLPSKAEIEAAMEAAVS